MVNARDHHGAPSRGNSIRRSSATGRAARHASELVLAVHQSARRRHVASRHDWYENFDLSVEASRAFKIATAIFASVKPRSSCIPASGSGCVPAWTGTLRSILTKRCGALWRHDLGQLRRAKVQVPELIDAPDWIDQLVLAADSFVFARPVSEVPDGESVIAGYPWFGDWGRDTMIALPGLACHRPFRHGAPHPADVRAVRRSGHVAERISRRGRRRPTTTPSMRRCGTSRRGAHTSTTTRDRMSLQAGVPGAAKHHRLARSRHALRHRRWIAKMVCCAPASPACSSPGWTPRSATGW